MGQPLTGVPVTSAFIRSSQPGAAAGWRLAAGRLACTDLGLRWERMVPAAQPSTLAPAAFRGMAFPVSGCWQEWWVPGACAGVPNLVLQVHGDFALQSSYPLQECLCQCRPEDPSQAEPFIPCLILAGLCPDVCADGMGDFCCGNSGGVLCPGEVCLAFQHKQGGVQANWGRGQALGTAWPGWWCSGNIWSSKACMRCPWVGWGWWQQRAGLMCVRAGAVPVPPSWP